MRFKPGVIRWGFFATLFLVAGVVLGVALERYSKAAVGPVLMFVNGKVRLRAYDEWTIEETNNLTLYNVESRIEFENIAQDPVTIRVPAQEAVKGFWESAHSWKIDEENEAGTAVVLSPGERHVLRGKAATGVLASRSGPAFGLVYYQLAVEIDDQLQIMGTKSKLTVH